MKSSVRNNSRLLSDLPIADGDSQARAASPWERLRGPLTRDWTRSYGGSLALHAILVLLPVSWFLSDQPDGSGRSLRFTTANNDAVLAEFEAQVQFELPQKTVPEKATPDREFVLGLLNEASLSVAPPNLPIIPESTRAAQNRTQNGNGNKDQQQPNALAAQTALIERDIQNRLDRAGGKSGAIQVSLIWNNGNDLDLYVETPVGDIIAFNYKRSRCGGELDVDMNARRTQSLNPVENVVWSTERAPRGEFVVGVNEFQNHGFRDPTRFLVSVKIDGETHHFRGTARAGQRVRGICKFQRTRQGVKFLEPPRYLGSESGKLIRK